MDTTIETSGPAGLNVNGQSALDAHPWVSQVLRYDTAEANRLNAAANGAWEAAMAARARRDREVAAREAEVNASNGTLSRARADYWDERIADVVAEFKQAMADSSEASTAAGRQRDVVDKETVYLNQLGAAGFGGKQAKPPKLPNTLPELITLVEQKTSERVNLAAERADREARPRPQSELTAKVEAEFRRLLDAPMTRVNFGEKGPALSFRSITIDAEPRDDKDGTPRAPDLRPIIARLAHDQILADAKRQIADRYRGLPPPMTAAEKTKALAKLDAEILAVELVEVAAIRAARVLGHRIGYRKGVDVRALLQLDGGPAPTQRSR